MRTPAILIVSCLPLLWIACSSSDDGSSPTAPNAAGAGGAAAGSGGSSGATAGGTAGSPEVGGMGGTGGPPSCDTLDPSSVFHATVDGSPDGDGTLASPWDLSTALNSPPGVEPGDTVCIHQGHYAGSFVVKQDGQDGAPVTIRAWPGDRVTLDGDGATDEPVLQIYHQWMIIRDLEITNGSEDRRSARPTGIYVGADHVKLVNLSVHDVGVGISGGQITSSGEQEGTDIELYGSLFYNNGWLEEDRGHGHHTYLTNRDSVVRMEENILFYAYGFGVHNYSSGDANYVRNYELVGNVWFLNGVPGGKLYDNCMIGHDGSLTVSGVVLRENYGWAMNPGDRDVRLGWDTPNENATLTDNYFVGQTIFQDTWSGISMEGNTFIGPVEGVDAADHPNNTYRDAAPAKNHVALRPNRYEPGRANIIVYNWEGVDEVEVDLSSFIAPGVAYAIYNAQNPYVAPVVSGTYEGGAVRLPMSGLQPAVPVGDPDAIGPDHRTGREFNVFVLRAAVCD